MPVRFRALSALPSRCARGLLVVAAALALVPAARAQAQGPAGPTIHPIFSAVPDLPWVDDAHRRFAAGTARLKLGPVEVMDVPPPPAPRAPALLREGRAALEKLRFFDAETALDQAVAEVLTTGGQGLNTDELSELFLRQAMAAQRADWKELTAPPTRVEPPKAREAYLRAATLTPGRVLEAQRWPPIAIASFRLAVEEVKARPRGGLVVRAPDAALVTVNGGPPQPGLVTVLDLPHGEHFIRVEPPGRRPWATVAPLADLSLVIEPPPMAPLSLDDASAAAQARRQGAVFALLGELKAGPVPQLELRLIDAASGVRRDATTVPFPGDPATLEAALMRLDEMARRETLTRRAAPATPGGPRLAIDPVTRGGAPAVKARFDDDPAAWARDRWPLLTAVGVALASAIVLGVAASR